jgi:hypothetical protein
MPYRRSPIDLGAPEVYRFLLWEIGISEERDEARRSFCVCCRLSGSMAHNQKGVALTLDPATGARLLPVQRSPQDAVAAAREFRSGSNATR